MKHLRRGTKVRLPNGGIGQAQGGTYEGTVVNGRWYSDGGIKVIPELEDLLYEWQHWDGRFEDGSTTTACIVREIAAMHDAERFN